MKLNYNIFSLLLLVIVVSCKNKVELPDNNATGKDYYPMQVGKYLIYDVDSVIYDDLNNELKHNSLQVMHTYDSSFTDLQGRNSLTISSYKRADSTQPWMYIRTDYATQTSTSIELQENKTRLIKFTFPVRDNYSWDGSVYIDGTDIEWMQDWRLRFYDYQKATAINNVSYDNTVSIKYVPSTPFTKDTSLTTKDEYFNYAEFNEVYAKNVGLVYKTLVHIKRDKGISDFRSGFRVSYKLKEHN